MQIKEKRERVLAALNDICPVPKYVEVAELLGFSQRKTSYAVKVLTEEFKAYAGIKRV